MGALLHYLTTGEGCDLIIICRGEFFFVHKAVIAAHSPVLERHACRSMFLGGEAHILDAVSPDVFRKVLTFMYTGDIPESHQSALAEAAQRPLSEKFPLTDAFLVTVKGKPATVDLLDGSSKTVDTITNSDKWAIFMAKQALMKDPYDNLPCQNSGDVFPELNVYLVAKQLEVRGLKDIAMQKIIAWFEKELHAGLPLSEDFHAWVDFVLRTYEDFRQPFFRLCTANLPVVEKDGALVSLLEKCNPSLWEVMVSVRTQWQKELMDQQEEFQKHSERFLHLKTDVDEQKAASVDLEKVHKSKMDALETSVSLADDRTRAAQAMAQQLDKLTQSLQRDLLKEKANAVRSMANNKENNVKKDNGVPKQDPTVPKLQKKIEELMASVKSRELALEQSKAANHKIKEELRRETEELRIELATMKDAFKRFKKGVNLTDACPGCHRRYNLRIDQDRYTSIGVGCLFCPYRVMWRGEDK